MLSFPSKVELAGNIIDSHTDNMTDSISHTDGLSFEEFNAKLPPLEKNGRVIGLLDYEITEYEWEGTKHPGVIPTLESKRMVWIKKAAGLGITEAILRYIAWKALCGNEWKNSQVIIVTGPNFPLAIKLIKRIKDFFPNQLPESSSLKVTLGSCVIEAFPSHHLEAVRSLTNPKFIFFDEADFFPPSQRNEALSAIDHYLGKSMPRVALVSTPNLPGGLFEQIEKDKSSIYEKMFLHYTIGVGTIYSNEELELAKRGGNFEREYGLKYGIGVGNLYPYQLVDAVTEDYDLSWKDGIKLRFVDPAYSNDELRGSKFAIVEAELLNGLVYIREASQYPRASPVAMQELIVTRDKAHQMKTLVDGAHPGLVRDLREKQVHTLGVPFNKELSNMTTESTAAVKERRVRIHSSFSDLLYQLKSITANGKGHPDKTKMPFDLGDCFQGVCNFLKTIEPVVINVDEYTAPKDTIQDDGTLIQC